MIPKSEYLIDIIFEKLKNYKNKEIFLEKENLEFSEMVHKVKSGFNENEVKLIPKNLGKKGFFEKFFQLFS